ncbi:phosphatase [Hoeflea sp. TYP-13]|uniref:phosphatase domain-containing putative toxin n=1 Tax=Hoeflea sp. TYP-13 TaxID=3230023 RepID=UPI0034C5EE49
MTRDIPSRQGMFSIATLYLQNGGRIGVCAMPGRFSDLSSDLQTISAWSPSIVLTLTERVEMDACGSGELGSLLERRGIGWKHLPIRDWGGLSGDNAEVWPALSSALHEALDQGDGVLTHCNGGHGRSGMIALRLLVERGEDPETALKRLRHVRPGAVQGQKQLDWATGG